GAARAGSPDPHALGGVGFPPPAVTVAHALPALPTGGGTGAADPPWTVGRLVLRDGRFVMSPSADRFGVAFRVAADLPELGTAGDAAAQWRGVTARRGRATLPGGAPGLAADAVVVLFPPARLVGRRGGGDRPRAPA